jgi:uncharacterized repeat protein (TIGR03837 family)
MTKTIDIFCSVIDNFGDIGVCWRLAKQCQHEYGLQVRLWVDNLDSFSQLEPAILPHLRQQFYLGIELRHWTPEAFINSPTPYEIVVEGFGCRLPNSFLAAMAQQSPPPRWINLEYLSAETWTLDCHGLNSMHPSLGLKQVFFFPSFEARGGGLLRERNLTQQRNAFNADLQKQFWQQLGYPQAILADYRLSLFAYENLAAPALLQTLSQQLARGFIAIPQGRIVNTLQTWRQQPLKTGDCFTLGSITVAILPFLSSSDYDHLLWACDINCVRGEDSFIRAHWAAKPLLWHIYPQDEAAHLDKLYAWQQVSSPFISNEWQQLQQAWVKQDTTPHIWHAFLETAQLNQQGHQQFCDYLIKQDDLCQRLLAQATHECV